MISRGLRASISLARTRPCPYQCQRHLERQWLPPPPPRRRTITTKPLPGDKPTFHNPTSLSSIFDQIKRRRPHRSSHPPALPPDEFAQYRDSLLPAVPHPSHPFLPPPDPNTLPAVLHLSSLPPTLLDSDFQRLASPGLHVDGWAGGLVKILPARHRHTKDHQGQYFLFFDTLVAARAYAVDALPTPARPEIHILPLHRLKALLRRFYPPPAEARHAPNLVPAPEGLHTHVFRPERDDARATRVRVRFEGSRITAATLRAAIAKDGGERGLEWAVRDGAEGVKPVSASGAWVATGFFSGEMEGARGEKIRAYDRFVVTFEEAGEARRFVRGWHGREMLDRRNERVMGVEVVGLW